MAAENDFGQILNALLSGDNTIRQNAEVSLNLFFSPKKYKKCKEKCKSKKKTGRNIYQLKRNEKCVCASDGGKKSQSKSQ